MSDTTIEEKEDDGNKCESVWSRMNHGKFAVKIVVFILGSIGITMGLVRAPPIGISPPYDYLTFIMICAFMILWSLY